MREFLKQLRTGGRTGLKPAILMYHRIAEPDIDPWKLAVSPARFASQLAALQAARVVLPLRELAEQHRAGQLPQNAVAITFDDGYACNALTAAPILARYRMPATFFLATGAIGREREFWWDELTRLVFDETAKGRHTTRIGNEEIPIELSDADEGEPFDACKTPRTPRQAAYLRLWQALRACEAEERRVLLGGLWRDLIGVAAPPARSSHRVMTPSEVRDLARSDLNEMGAHTVNHPALGDIDRESQRREIEESKAACAAFTGIAPLSFAYPHGNYSPATLAELRAAGFAIACTTREEAVEAGTDLLELPRMQVKDWDGEGLVKAIRALG